MKKLLLSCAALLCGASAWAAAGDVVTTAEGLSNSKVYYLKSARTDSDYDKYLLYDATSHAGFLASNFGTGNTSIRFGEENKTQFQFAIYKYGEKYYFYSLAADAFVGNNNNNNGNIPMVASPTNDVEIRFEGTVTNYKALLSTNHQYALNVSNTGNHGVVNWTDGYAKKGDDGNCYQIIEAADLSTEMQTSIETKIRQSLPVSATINVSPKTGVGSSHTYTVDLRPGTYNVADYLNGLGLTCVLKFEGETATVQPETANQTFTVQYTEVAPYAASFDELTSGNKWVSFFTLNGRMYVYDDNCVYNDVKKYPCIDKATFTNLTDRKFWGFICDDPFTASTVKIVNKGAGKDKGTLYLTANGIEKPLLLATDRGSYFTNEWVIETGKTSEGVQYYGIKANGTNQYINNYWGKGFMVTNPESASKDNGSNIKFTSEIGTYNLLKERALNAPYHAAHSLNEDARAAIKAADAELGETATDAQRLAKYKEVIADINNEGTDAGFIQFSENKYYYLRNYTPAGKNTFVLASSDGASAKGVQVNNGEIGTADAPMTYSNINAIWKITKKNPDDEGYTGGSTDIGVSKTIGRDVTHINSGKKMASTFANNSVQLTADGSVYYFVNLGAGQHFLKIKQYDGSGQQAMAAPFACADNGNVSRGTDGVPHLKNTRATWYGIEVSSIKVTISGAGYSTLYLPFGVNLPIGTDLKAYVVSAVSATEATMTEVPCIPANRGVILKGTAGRPYELLINDAAAWDESVTNKLLGSNMHENINVDAYVLSQPAGKEVGLYKAAMTDGSWLNNDNKAYLPASAITGNAPSLSFVFDTETSIQGIDAAKADNSIYDLSGRRVKNAQKGIFIINGKKVIK